MKKFSAFLIENNLEIEIYDLPSLETAIASRKLNRIKNIDYWFEFPQANRNGFTFIVAIQGKEIIGICELEENPYDRKEIWMKSISTKKEFRNKGIATKLLERTVKYLKGKNKILIRSETSDDGQKYTKDKFTEMLNKNKINWK